MSDYFTLKAICKLNSSLTRGGLAECKTLLQLSMFKEGACGHFLAKFFEIRYSAFILSSEFM
eukprot:m.79757 g.79757  ORF g.79757 m.79757 type:complete len:62 (+) comp8615_c1_seq1:240-425(+)